MQSLEQFFTLKDLQSLRYLNGLPQTGPRWPIDVSTQLKIKFTLLCSPTDAAPQFL